VTGEIIMSKLQSAIESYWTRRAPSYTDVIRKNLENGWEKVWAEMLVSFFPEPEKGQDALRVLDIGTGPGYYALILARRGYRVTAVDCTKAMLDEARRNAGALADRITFKKMDAHRLDLPADSFDVIVTRNLTWNLEDPARAYADWLRVLRPGGRMMNFDANWYAYLFDEEKRREYAEDRVNTLRAGVPDHGAYSDGARWRTSPVPCPSPVPPSAVGSGDAAGSGVLQGLGGHVRVRRALERRGEDQLRVHARFLICAEK
jgi:ubiquinone/menaquinone biosynthesis C-methylase UbiE